MKPRWLIDVVVILLLALCFYVYRHYLFFDNEPIDGLKIDRARCIELCLELTRTTDDQLQMDIKKCELQFSNKQCRLVP